MVDRPGIHQNPCGNGGTCVNLEGGFKCICPPDTTGDYCTEEVRGGSWYTSGAKEGGQGGDYLFNWEEVVGIIVSLFGIVILVSLWVACRRMVVGKKVNGNQLLQADNNQCNNSSLLGGSSNGHAGNSGNNGSGNPGSTLNNGHLEMTEMDQRPLIPSSGYSRSGRTTNSIFQPGVCKKNSLICI